MRKLSFSLYRNATDTNTKLLSLDWSEWVNRLSDLRTGGSKDGPGFIPGHIDNGAVRNDKNVNYIDAIALDLDSHSYKVIEQVQEKTASLESLWYTTHSFDPETNAFKIRAIFPLDKPLPP